MNIHQLLLLGKIRGYEISIKVNLDIEKLSLSKKN